MKSSRICIFVTFFTVAVQFCAAKSSYTKNDIDSTIYLNEIAVSAVKQGQNLKMQPIASTIISQSEIENRNILSMKDASDIAPNFFIPDYGSRVTSSIYVRGLGTRIDQPVIGLNIDNIPIMDKNNYDFDIADIARIEIIRGPQSALFGRNTMGGLINIYTVSPFSYQGLKFMGEYSSGNTYKLSAGYYTKLNQQFGIGVTAYFTSSDGFFKNSYNGKKCDTEKLGGGRFKLQWHPKQSVSIENVLFFSTLHQGGYPYESLASHTIAYNDTCFYKRTSVNDGLSVKWSGERVSLTNTTSVQYIDDNMTLDQDFLPDPYFTLTQARKETAITNEFIAKSTSRQNYHWMFGSFSFYKHLNMDAPVTFKDTGIKSLIEDNRNEANPYYPISWDSREFDLESHFTNPNYGFAVYHQSEYKLNRFNFTAAIRLDFEHTALNYNSYCNTGFSTIKAEDNSIFHHTDVNIDDFGNLSKSFFQLLPKVSVSYMLPTQNKANIYGSVAKGYKAGGYNTQMFSDVLQQKIMATMGMSMNYNVNDIVGYKPEKSWNFEVGSHFETSNRQFSSDLSLFFIDCKDMQMTIFPDGTTTGRIMTNAGHAHSYGLEYAMKLDILSNLRINASYGYTNAKFKEYDNGKTDFSGKVIPYAPQNTVYASATYSIPLKTKIIEKINITGDYKGVGNIYWNESNDVYQPYYGQCGAAIRIENSKYSVDLWGQNLTNTDFKTFYFVSIGNTFLQKGKPRRFGVTLRLNL